MTGRVSESNFTFSGGTTEIELGGATGRAPRNRLFRATNRGVPGGMMVQLRSEALANTLDSHRPIADVVWQVGAGIHSATVDIGLGCTFSVAAAEILEVTVRMNTEYDPENVPTSSIPFKCFGVAAPSSAQSAVPARFTNQANMLGGATTSNAIDVPKWARRLWIQEANTGFGFSDPAFLPNTTANWDDAGPGAGPAIISERAWNAEVPFIVPGNARRVWFYYAAHVVTDLSLLLTWELELG